jgi:hypothetical protein
MLPLIRNLQPEDELPWTDAELGWPRQRLDLSTVWVALAADQPVGLLIGANVHQTLLLLRLLGRNDGKGYWIHPLWDHVRRACLHRGIASFWSFLDNGRDAERALIRLMLYDCHTGQEQEWTSIAIAGRWIPLEEINAGTGGHPLVSSTAHRSGSGHLDRNDGLRTFPRQRGRKQQQPGAGAADASPAAAGATGGAAESGLSGGPTASAVLDQWISGGQRLEHPDGDAGGSTYRSKLYRTVFEDR